MVTINFDLLTETLKNNNVQIICVDECGDMFVGDMCYMLKYNRNVYRVFVGGNGLLCFQLVQYAFDVNGDEYYDDALDIWYGTVSSILETEKTFTDEMYNTIMMLMRETEYKKLKTIYE